MRTIESKSYEAGGARLKLLFVEAGKILPFRVQSQHVVDGEQSNGTLAAVADEDEGREQFEFNCSNAEKAGWALTARGLKLIALPPPPAASALDEETPQKKRPGRPRKERSRT